MKPSDLLSALKKKGKPESSSGFEAADDMGDSDYSEEVDEEAISDMKDFMSASDPKEKYLMFKELVKRCQE